jgi:hypothetical protein
MHRTARQAYLTTGAQHTIENLVMPLPLDVIGNIPDGIEHVCETITHLDPCDPAAASMIATCLENLASIDLNTSSPGTVASVLSLRIKYSLFSKGFLSGSRVPSDELKRTYEYYLEQTSPCWDAFRKVFTTMVYSPCQNLREFSKYVSRFIYFFQVYELVSEKTARNQKNAEELADLLLAALLKQAASTPPDRLGELYHAPKMVREVILKMLLKYPESHELQNRALSCLELSYDYLNCLAVQEFKRPLLEVMFRLRRRSLDESVERNVAALLNQTSGTTETHEASLLRSVAEGQQTSLLLDFARCGLMNTLGLEEARAYMAPGVLHVKLIVANEAIHLGYLVILIHAGNIVLKYVPGDPKDGAQQVDTALKAARDGDVSCLQLWKNLAESLGLLSIRENVAKVTKGIRPERVYVYPDGFLWNVPWEYLIDSLWDVMAKTTVDAHPIVAVKLGARSHTSERVASRASFLAGWNYEHNEAAVGRRRGEACRGYLQDLPGARLEVESLKKLWGCDGRKAVESICCTADQVLEQVRAITEPSIIHIACHGMVMSDAMPALMFPKKEGGSNYTALHYEKLMRCDWRWAELVFANACFGAAGKPFVGGPALGLHEALSIAGGRRLIAPLWPVLDDTARELAVEFYSRLIDDPDYLRAFSASRRELDRRASPSARLTLAAYNFMYL